MQRNGTHPVKMVGYFCWLGKSGIGYLLFSPFRMAFYDKTLPQVEMILFHKVPLFITCICRCSFLDMPIRVWCFWIQLNAAVMAATITSRGKGRRQWQPRGILQRQTIFAKDFSSSHIGRMMTRARQASWVRGCLGTDPLILLA